MALIEVWQNQRSPSVEDTITIPGYDFTGSTAKLQMRLESGSTLKVDAAAVVVSAGVGSLQLRYDWAALDVDTAGRYSVWWRISLPSGLAQDSDEFVVLIKAHLGAVSQVTIDSLRDHVETGITDDALQILLDDAVAQVENRFGTDAAILYRSHGAGSWLRLKRPALTITSIIERDSQLTLLYTLGVTDYDILNGGRTLERLSGGLYASQYWGHTVDVLYTPKPEQALRDRVAIDLVRLAVQYNALEQESIGSVSGYQSRSLDYLAERERILRAIPASRGFSFA